MNLTMTMSYGRWHLSRIDLGISLDPILYIVSPIIAYIDKIKFKCLHKHN